MATPGALPQPALPPLPHLQAVTGRRERGGGEDIMHSPHIIQANVGALAERDLEGEFLGRKHASQLTAAWKHVTVDGAPSDGGFFSARCKAKRNSQTAVIRKFLNSKFPPPWQTDFPQPFDNFVFLMMS